MLAGSFAQSLSTRAIRAVLATALNGSGRSSQAGARAIGSVSSACCWRVRLIGASGFAACGLAFGVNQRAPSRKRQKVDRVRPYNV